MVSSGWLCLAAMVVAYGCANLLQSIAAVRTQLHHSMHPSLLWRLAGQRTYIFGVACQTLGFLLAFAARRHLPLFLVQASVSAGLGVMAILGVALLKWRLPRAELLLLGLLGLGIAGLVISAKPGGSRPITFVGIMVLAGVLVLIGVLGIFACRLHGAPGSVALGALAGLAFGAAAIDSRALANTHSIAAFFVHPLLYLLFAHALVGQLLLAMAMQRGSTTAAVASMDAASTAPAAIIGLAMLGDQIWPGRQWLAAAGFTCTLVAVLGLTRFAQPQHDESVEPVIDDPTVLVPALTTVAGSGERVRDAIIVKAPWGAAINTALLGGALDGITLKLPTINATIAGAMSPVGAGPHRAPRSAASHGGPGQNGGSHHPTTAVTPADITEPNVWTSSRPANAPAGAHRR